MAKAERALLESGQLDSLRGARTEGRRQETAEDQKHYYEDFGLTMQEGQYKEAKKRETEYERGVENTRSAIASGYSALESARNDALGQLPTLPTWESWKSENLRAVRITDESGTQVEQTYWLTPEMIESMFSDKEFAKAYPHATFEDGSVNIIPFIGHEARGAELHEELGKATAAIQAQFMQEIGVANKDLNSARSAIGTSFDTETAKVQQQEGFLNQSVAQTQEYRSLLRKKYADKLSRMRGTIEAMGGNNG